MSWDTSFHIGYNNGFPHLCGNSFSHNHSAIAATSFDQVDKLQQCIKSLEKHVEAGFSNRKEALVAELEADKKMLTKISKALYKIEIAKRTSASTVEKIEETVQRTVAAAMKQHTAELNKQLSQVIEQKVQSAMAKFLPEIRKAVAEEVAQGVMEKLTQATEVLDVNSDN